MRKVEVKIHPGRVYWVNDKEYRDLVSWNLVREILPEEPAVEELVPEELAVGEKASPKPEAKRKPGRSKKTQEDDFRFELQELSSSNDES